VSLLFICELQVLESCVGVRQIVGDSMGTYTLYVNVIRALCNPMNQSSEGDV
jgi:hypothetical protein